MQWTIPGTVLAAQTEDAEKIRDVFNAFFLAGNISLSQVSAISGLEPYMIQNWVRRKYLSNSQGKNTPWITSAAFSPSICFENPCPLIRSVTF